MKSAFTMIELVFVIVIIGILSAIALPMLSATKSDAKGAKIVSSLVTCIHDAGNHYMMYGSFGGLTQSANATAACQYARECFGFSENDSNGSLTVNSLATTDKKCLEAQRIAQENLLSTTHQINF